MSSPHLQRKQPWWHAREQQWAEEHFMASHADALYRFGEYVIFILLWTSQDYEADLVGQCRLCIDQDPLSVGYANAARADCPSCYGTGFEGGYRAIIVRPAIITDRDPDTREDRRVGEVTNESLSLQTTNDFYARTGDLMVRRGNDRYRVSQMETNVIRTGFAHPGHEESVGGLIRAARLESNQSAPLLALPPTPEDVEALLASASLDRHYVVGVGRDDDIRGPLVPPKP